jgi:FKBP-type peptidyl-prolyl cis-trans isomerase FkpA
VGLAGAVGLAGSVGSAGAVRRDRERDVTLAIACGAWHHRPMPSRRVFVFLLLAPLAAACGDDTPTSPTPDVPFSATDLRAGTGAEATNGRTVTMDYTLWLYSETAPEHKGQRIEGGTFQFVLGSNQVIPGWNQGIVGMREGGSRRLVIPPGLAYGSQGNSSIPPNSTLVFDVELLSVQ